MNSRHPAAPSEPAKPPATRRKTADDSKTRGDPASQHFTLAASPLYRIVRTAGMYAHIMDDALKASGVDLMSWRALMIVDEASPSSVSEIAERSVTRLSTMTRVVQRLEVKRLVRLARRPDDGRVTDVHLTPLGKRLLENVRNVASQIYNDALKDISSAEVSALNSLIQRVFSNLASAPPRP